VRLREIEAVARNAIEKAALARQNDLYREDLRRRRRQASAEIIIESPAMRSLFEQAMQIAQVDASVLIEGETGVGKEVVAWFIHSHSPRRDRVFATLNCGALPDTLIDSELFGFEEGAFTGAGEPRPGILEVSDGGSLLLDEVGDLSSAGQIRLLRFLERGLVRRLGRTREQVVDVRVLAATHRDLGAMVDRNEFRQDLFHRLVVLRMAIPPLRERPEDVLPLARHFAVLLTAAGATPPAFTHTAEQALLAYAWPGNVRELRNAVERACLSARIAAEDAIGPERLALPASPGGGGALLSLGEAQRRHVLDVLKSVGGNRQGAAEVLGVTERHLYRLLRQARGSAGAG
jgi:DNA-binding NtrC family response regulator